MLDTMNLPIFIRLILRLTAKSLTDILTPERGFFSCGSQSWEHIMILGFVAFAQLQRVK